MNAVAISTARLITGFSVCRSVCLTGCVSVCLEDQPSAYLSTCNLPYLDICVSVCLKEEPSAFCLLAVCRYSTSISVCLFPFLSDCLRACLPIRSACLPYTFASLSASFPPPRLSVLLACSLPCPPASRSRSSPPPPPTSPSSASTLRPPPTPTPLRPSKVRQGSLPTRPLLPLLPRMQNAFTFRRVNKHKHDLLTQQTLERRARGSIRTGGRLEDAINTTLRTDRRGSHVHLHNLHLDDVARHDPSQINTHAVTPSFQRF